MLIRAVAMVLGVRTGLGVGMLCGFRAWLLHDFAEDFYGEDLRLVVVGYIRPEVLLH